MAYFIHNKYDKDSISKVMLQSNGSYTYNADNAVTVIDYYGLLESGDNTYELVDTTTMGVSVINTLNYSDITLTENEITPDQNSVFKFVSSINIKSIQRGSVTSAGTVTISAVDTSKTLLNVSGNGSGLLSSPTTVTITVNSGTITYEAIEYM